MEHEEQLLGPELKKQQTEFQELFASAQLLERENNAATADIGWFVVEFAD